MHKVTLATISSFAQGRFRLGIRKVFFTERVDGQVLEEAAKEVGESFFLEVIKKRVDIALRDVV